MSPEILSIIGILLGLAVLVIFALKGCLLYTSYDPELAKQLLAEAGYPDGFYLRIDARSDSDMNADQVSQAIASYLEKVGITTEVNLLPRASFYEKVDAENLQSSFFMAGWGDGSGEGMVIFNDMLYTYNGKPGICLLYTSRCV